MFLKYFCLIFINLIVICKGTKYFRCCSKEKEFSSNFTCISSTSNETLIRTLNQTDFNSFTIETDSIIDHLPNCKKKQILKLDNVKSEILKYKEICFDSDGTNFIGVYCDDGVLSEKNESKSLMFYRTCCPKNYTYNKEDGTCQPNLKESIIKNELNGIIDLFSTGPPICKKNEILVHSEIEFSKGNLFRDLEKHLKDSYCFNEILHADNKLMIYKCELQNFCNRNLCIKKCCDNGESYINYVCEPNLYDYINPIFYDNKKNLQLKNHEYGITFDLKCKYGKVPITVDIHSKIDSQTGILVLSDGSSTNPEQYCMEKSIYIIENDTKSIGEFLLLECQVVNEAGYYIKIVGYSLSIICLIITIIVYLNLPELWNVNGKILIGTMITMLICYSIVTVSLHKWNAGLGCAVIGYIIYYSFLSTFAWINVLSFDFYFKMDINYSTNISPYRMVYYLMYAIGCPLLMTIIICILNVNLNYSNIWSPQIGNKACFFDQTLSFAHIVYFIVPIIIQIVINVFIFIISARYIYRVNKSMAIIAKASIRNKKNREPSQRNNKSTFILLLKLFFVMGGAWTLEIFANIYHTHLIYNNISDAINSLNGVMIFIVFIMKKRIIDKLIGSWKKLPCYDQTRKDEDISKSYATQSTSLQ